MVDDFVHCPYIKRFLTGPLGDHTDLGCKSFRPAVSNRRFPMIELVAGEGRDDGKAQFKLFE